MRTNRCTFCLSSFDANYKSNVCQSCESDKVFGFPTMIETDSLYTMKNVSRNRLKELDKRTMTPDAGGGKDYYVGTKHKGKILDKTVDLTP